jgi:hypothetical protein
MERLAGTARRDIDINDVRSYSISKTLADEEVRYGGAILIDMVIAKVAHEMDRNPRDFEVSHHNFGHTDSLSWWVSVEWWIECNHCEYPAVEQGTFDDDLCNVHYHEAGSQAQADLENDDIKAGVYDDSNGYVGGV